MLKSEVKIGSTYVAKINGHLTKVQIKEATIRRGYGPGRKDMTHWLAINLATGREVRIKSAVKLQREVTS